MERHDLKEIADNTLKGLLERNVLRVQAGNQSSISESLVVEAPLEIHLTSNLFPDKPFRWLITMRTPGSDEHLVRGLLFAEGIIDTSSDIISIVKTSENHIAVKLNKGLQELNSIVKHRHVMSSSCGLCGKEGAEIMKYASKSLPWKSRETVSKKILFQLPEQLNRRQKLFEKTGGLHAAGLFSISGELLNIQEDIGRHNAVDKLVGKELTSGIRSGILLLSGRCSFELIQKSAMAGFAIVCCVGAPSSLAVEIAEDEGITLVGFLKEKSFNVYTHPFRVS